MIWAGAAIAMQWASAWPVRFVLSSATTPPTCVTPSQIARYSGRLGINRQTLTPGSTPSAIAHRE